jgi:succinoglycan biosynthesis transport protein ExoP
VNSQIVPRQPQVDQAPQDLELTDVWKFLLRRWLILAVFCLLGLLAGFISYMRAPRLYNAVVTVEMNRDTTSGLGLQDLSGAGSTFGIGQEFMTDMLTQQAVLTNASTALSVIDHLQLMETPPYSSIDTKSSTATHLGGSKGYRVDPANVRRDRAVALFDSKLRVTPVKNTRLMNVAYTDPDPVRAAQVANAIVEAYLTNHTRTRYEATSKAATWLNQQLDDLKHQAEDTHHRVAALETNGGLIGTMIPTENGSSNGNGNIEAAGSNPDVSKLMALNAALNQADLARIQQGTIYQLSQTSDPNALLDVSGAKLAVGEGTALAAGSPAMQLIQNLRNQEASLKLRLASARVTYAAKNPVMQELQNQIDSIHSQIAEQMGMVQINAKRNYLLAQENENAIRKEVEAQQQKVTTLGNRLADVSARRGGVGAQALSRPLHAPARGRHRRRSAVVWHGRGGPGSSAQRDRVAKPET